MYNLEDEDINIGEFHKPHYKCVKGKYYRYNGRVGNEYYCPGNMVIVSRLGKEARIGDDGYYHTYSTEKTRINKLGKHQLLIDYFILNIEDNTLIPYNPHNTPDCFIDAFKNISNINIRIEKQTGNKIITMQTSGQEYPIIINTDRFNRITGYSNHNLKRIGNNFLRWCEGLKDLDLPNVEEIGDDFLNIEERYYPDNNERYKNSIQILSLGNVKKIGDRCLESNDTLEQFYADKLEETGNEFLSGTSRLCKVEYPNLRHVGINAFKNSTKGEKLKRIYLPKLEEPVGIGFFNWHHIDTSHKVCEVNLPRLSPQITESLQKWLKPKEIIALDDNLADYIDSKDIADLDKQNKLTTSEIRIGRQIIQQLHQIEHEKNRSN